MSNVIRSLVTIGVITTSQVVLSADIDLLAEVIYYEARSESVQGQLAVAQVVLNRVKSSKFPDSIEGVIHQKRNGVCQFSYYCEGVPLTMPNKNSKKEAYSLAKRFLHGNISVVGVEDADHYFNSSLVNPKWAYKMDYRGKVGNHTFLREYRWR